MAKNKNMADAKHVKLCIEQVTKAIDWLEAEHDIPFKVLDSFLYPSHSSYRMHAVPETTGAALIQRLENAANHCEILISCNLKITDLQSILALGQLKNVDYRIFGKPFLKSYRRMGVVLAPTLEKAKKAANKIFVKAI
mgnify:CR=1 FL=1